MRQKVKMHGNTYERCSLDESMCNGEGCRKDPNLILCDTRFDEKVALYACELAKPIAEKCLDSVARNKPIRSEMVENSKRILELLKQIPSVMR